MSQTESLAETDGDPARVEAFDVGWLTAPAALMRHDEPEGAGFRFPVFGDGHDARGRLADRLGGPRVAGLTVLPGLTPTSCALGSCARP